MPHVNQRPLDRQIVENTLYTKPHALAVTLTSKFADEVYVAAVCIQAGRSTNLCKETLLGTFGPKTQGGTPLIRTEMYRSEPKKKKCVNQCDVLKELYVVLTSVGGGYTGKSTEKNRKRTIKGPPL